MYEQEYKYTNKFYEMHNKFFYFSLINDKTLQNGFKSTPSPRQRGT